MTLIIYLIMAIPIIYFIIKKYKSMSPEQLQDAKNKYYSSKYEKKERKRDRRRAITDTIILFDIFKK